VTPEQRTAHLRMLETLPHRKHECIGPDVRQRRGGHSARDRDAAYTPEFLAEKKRQIEKLRCRGFNQKQISELWGVSEPTISRYLRLYKERCSQR
jgi:DNA-binding NarL/FixJ family response regulator